jgi:hypothetical protein
MSRESLRLDAEIAKVAAEKSFVPLPYESVKAEYDKRDAMVQEAIAGLTPDEIKRSTEYIDKKQAFNLVFAQRANAEQYLLRHYKNRYHADRIQERDARRKAKV